MAIKTTIKITKGGVSYTLWAIDGLTYGPTDPAIPERGLTEPAEYFEVTVNGTPLEPPSPLRLTMQGPHDIVCQWVSPRPGTFAWTLDRQSMTVGQPNAAIALRPECFANLEEVNGIRLDPISDDFNPSRIEIFHLPVR